MAGHFFYWLFALFVSTSVQIHHCLEADNTCYCCTLGGDFQVFASRAATAPARSLPIGCRRRPSRRTGTVPWGSIRDQASSTFGPNKRQKQQDKKHATEKPRAGPTVSKFITCTVGGSSINSTVLLYCLYPCTLDVSVLCDIVSS